MDVRAEAIQRDAPLPDPYLARCGHLAGRFRDGPHPAGSSSHLQTSTLLRSGEQSDLNYRLLAADTLQSAVDQGHADGGAYDQRLAEVYRGLAEIARASGDSAQALRYLQLAAD